MSQATIPHHIQVYENHSGPIPTYHAGYHAGALHYAFVAYSDAESGLYGYGHTEPDAIADYCRNQAEAYCNGCTDCRNISDCILTSGGLSQEVKARIESYYSRLYTATSEPRAGYDSHEAWRDLHKD